MMLNNLLKQIELGDKKSLARSISLIENEAEGYEQILLNLRQSNVPIIGITGPPGAGKSTLVDKLINELINDNKKVAVLCIDPSSPFHYGALLGDRIRMNRWYNNDNVFIRSMASKASLGGLCPKVIEVSELLKSADFDIIIIETIGVGQNEIEIASIADITVVVLVPEAGDEIQTMKAGLMEVAYIFVVNKCDRASANTFVKHLSNMLVLASSTKTKTIPIVKTIASKNEGILELLTHVKTLSKSLSNSEKNNLNTATKVYKIIQTKKMEGITLHWILENLKLDPNINLHKFVESILKIK